MHRIRKSLGLVTLSVLTACGVATPSGGRSSNLHDVAVQVTSTNGPTKATGGGHLVREGSKVSFGVNGAATDGGGAKGTVQVVDHGTGERFHGSVTAIACVGGVTTMTGTLVGASGGTFEAKVTDQGEPGGNDTFAFTTSGGYAVSGTLAGGNIQTSGACATASPSPPPPCHRCVISGAQAITESSYPSNLIFDFAGNLNEAATGQFTFTVTDTFTGAISTITNTSATVVMCEIQSDVVEVVRIEGTATRTATNGESATGIYYLQVVDDAGSGTFTPEITIQYQDTAGGNFFLGTGGQEGISALAVETDAPCP